MSVSNFMRLHLQVGASKKEVKDRMNTTIQTQKITEAMRLVAASRVRKAQNAVLAGRPFSDNLIKVGLAVGLVEDRLLRLYNM